MAKRTTISAGPAPQYDFAPDSGELKATNERGRVSLSGCLYLAGETTISNLLWCV
jgi:hypothetical protein